MSYPPKLKTVDSETGKVELSPAVMAAIDKYIEARAAKDTDPLVTMDQLCERYDVSTQTIYRWMDQHGFPKSMTLVRTARWKLSEVLAWEAEAASQAQTA